MYPDYVSRQYIKEKMDGLNNYMNGLNLEDDTLLDKVDDEEVNRVRFAVKNYCEALLNEFGWR